LYAGYVLAVGAGSAPIALRFLSVPIVLATTCCLAVITRSEGLVLAGLALFVSLASPLSPWRTIGCTWAFAKLSDSTQVLDTRASVCRDGAAIANFDRDEPLPRHAWLQSGLAFRDSQERVHLSGPGGQPAMGYFGFAAGHGKIIVDPMGVTDPLMARVPAKDIVGRWLPGHVERPVPAGYLESLASGENRIADPALHQYYASLRMITSGPLFSPARWREIVAMNLGMRNHLLETYRRTRLMDPASR
jgi:arabinofuranosyltransferase